MTNRHDWSYQVIYYITLSFLALCIFSISGCGNQKNISQALSEINQNPDHYLNPDQPTLSVLPPQEAALAQDFLTRYFLPWDAGEGQARKMQGILVQYQSLFANYKKSPGRGINYNPLTSDFIQSLSNNADLAHFPSINQPGIVVHPTSARSLPTQLPSFGNPKQAGEGYPFDNFQESYIAQGVPLRILHQSKDKLWYLILMNSYSGWVPSQDVALVSPEFITNWKSYPYLVSARDNIPPVGGNNLSPAPMRVGVLYPNVTAANNNQQYAVLIPILGPDGNAQTTQVLVDRAYMHAFPLPISAANIAAVAKNFIGTPYGWGGLYDQRDCSQTTQDLFATFGIWLPRNSGMQGMRGEVISIDGLGDREKLKIIERQGIPFFTFIQAPRHIVLYIGMHQGVPYVLQDVWGLKTHDVLGREGRIVLGKTVITPVNFGHEYMNITTFLHRATRIIILRPDLLLQKS